MYSDAFKFSHGGYISIADAFVINDIFSEVVGIYADPAGSFHGLLWAAGQAFSLDFPGMPHSEAHSINSNGDITGAYIIDPETYAYRGFVAYRKNP